MYRTPLLYVAKKVVRRSDIAEKISFKGEELITFKGLVHLPKIWSKIVFARFDLFKGVREFWFFESFYPFFSSRFLPKIYELVFEVHSFVLNIWLK